MQITEMERQLARMRVHLAGLEAETVHDRTLVADRHMCALFGSLEAMSQEVAQLRAEEAAA